MPARFSSTVALLASFVLVGVAAATGCGATSGDDASGTFKLGVEAPLTGPDAESGQAILNATKMAFAQENYKIGDTKVELVPVDDKADPAAAVSAYTYAINRDGVQAMFGNWNTDVTLGVMPLSERYQMPHFFYGALGQAVDQKVAKTDPKYFFGKQYPPPGEQQAAYVEALGQAVDDGLELPNGKTVALFGEDTDFGRGVVKTLGDEFRADGWEVKGKQFFAIDATEHNAMVNTFLRKKVSVIAGTGTALQGIASLLKQTHNQGFDGLFICDGLSYTGDWHKAAGAASDGVMDLNVLYATEEAKKFEAAYKKRYKSNPSPFSAGITYDYAKFLIKIMERAQEKHGELTKETLTKVGTDELKRGKISYDGMMMKEYRFTQDSWPVPLSGDDGYLAPVVQYWDGKPSITYPRRLAQSEVRLPEAG